MTAAELAGKTNPNPFITLALFCTCTTTRAPLVKPSAAPSSTIHTHTTAMDLHYNHGSEVQVVRANYDEAPDLVAIGGMHSVHVLYTVRRDRPPLSAAPTRD